MHNEHVLTIVGKIYLKMQFSTQGTVSLFSMVLQIASAFYLRLVRVRVGDIFSLCLRGQHDAVSLTSCCRELMC